jgi:hypothetical protein
VEQQLGKKKDQQNVPKYTVSEFMEKLGYGNYTRWVTFVMGLVSFADNAEIAVTAIIISETLSSLTFFHSFICTNYH